MMHQRIELAATMPLPDLGRSGLWCILTTKGGNTIALARSLIAAGYPAWTPLAWNERRRRRTDERFEVEASVTPTYVFAWVGADQREAADGVAMFDRLADAQVSPHPDFTVFRYGGRTPLLAARSLRLLSAEQADQEAQSQLRIATEILRVQRIADEKQKAAALTALRKQAEAARAAAQEARAAAREALRLVRAGAQQLAAGDQVRADQAILKGMVGVVQDTHGHETLVLFGGAVPFTIETWLLRKVGVGSASAI